MRDDMKKGDKVLFYHSNSKPPGVAGVAKVVKESYPDVTAFDPKDKHFDPKIKTGIAPLVHGRYQAGKKTETPRFANELRKVKSLEGMVLLQKGSRLSVQPVTKKQFETVCQQAEKPAPTT